MEGNIVVDGVLASCYDSFDHDLAHIVLTPMQWLPDIMGWIFGKEKGSSSYVEIVKDFGKWMVPFNHFYKSSKF